MKEAKSLKDGEIINTKSANVKCCGKKAPYDHPMVYLEIDKDIGFINCPYCSKKFTLTER